VFEKVCDLSDLWAVVCEGGPFVFLSLCVSLLFLAVLLRSICFLSVVIFLVGKLLLWAILSMVCHSVVRFFSLSGSLFILLM